MLMLGSVWQFTIWVWYVIGGGRNKKMMNFKDTTTSQTKSSWVVVRRFLFHLYTIRMIDLVERINIPYLDIWL
jgi:hypothetical protein